MRRLAPLVLLAACISRAPAPATLPAGSSIDRVRPDAAPGPRTRAERSDYTETTRHAEVLAFLDSLHALAPGTVSLGEAGRTSQGRVIPFAIASRPGVQTAEDARRTGRPIVYVQANIHAGEIEGKEALLALLRDLALDPKRNVLDSIVLIAVPIYNGDGNEKFASQSVNRTEQNGPEQVGERANAQGLDLNRDYIKAEAPETRASLAMFARFDPDVFVDLHTTDGSFHGYALTYSPSLSPAAALGPWTRDSLLPELRRRVRERRHYETFDYGNFDSVYEERDLTAPIKQGWYTYDHRPRFGTNYYGIRGGVSVLSEAFSHDPLERRVKSTYAFVAELLSLSAERGAEIRARRASDAGRLVRHAEPERVAVRGRLTTAPYTGPVLVERIVHAADSTAVQQPGVPRGLRRTGEITAQPMKVYDRFESALDAVLPAMYLLDSTQTAAVALLRLHGVRVDVIGHILGDTDFGGEREHLQAVESFVVDSASRATRAFQGHHELTLVGHVVRRRVAVPDGTYVVYTAQPLGRLAAWLLEPMSDDGFVTWNVFDAGLAPGREFPVRRIVHVTASTSN
jgi:Zinc carboxypeptidase